MISDTFLSFLTFAEKALDEVVHSAEVSFQCEWKQRKKTRVQSMTEAEKKQPLWCIKVQTVVKITKIVQSICSSESLDMFKKRLKTCLMYTASVLVFGRACSLPSYLCFFPFLLFCKSALSTLVDLAQYVLFYLFIYFFFIEEESKRNKK